ncbi:MAG: ZIP family metal transporter [Planctomycetes bacterium]|nr:ZIP family metal transporter [Planctomycetota bacterium]
MDDLLWILGSGILMSLLALSGSLSLVMSARLQERLLLPLVALAAGSLLGGAFFHMMPAALAGESGIAAWIWLALGFTGFLGLEQFLHWHHCHDPTCAHGVTPMAPLILIADGLHNFVGGLAIAEAFIIDHRLGIGAFIAAAAHELPQELGDFGVLVQAGLGRGRALLYNFLSALTFPLGGLVAWVVSWRADLRLLLAFAAGNFIYVAAADLIPIIKVESTPRRALLHLAFLVLGLSLLLGIRLVFADTD